MAGRLRSLRDDRPGALELASEAVHRLSGSGIDPLEILSEVESEIRSDPSYGVLFDRGAGCVGIALWDRPGPLGLHVHLLSLRPGEATTARYGEFIEAIARDRGPVVILPSDLPGLSRDESETMMRRLGFAPFSRSEMVYPADRAPPTAVPPSGATLRPFRAEDGPDVARVHAAAYDGRFDRYLFLDELDPLRDADRMLRGLVGGRWGTFLPAASIVARERGRLVAETLVVTTSRGALLADVATDPAFAGRGYGRAVVSATVHALRESGEPRLRLAVTESNRRAVRLYESLGFVRHLGPVEMWYDPRRIPVGARDV